MDERGSREIPTWPVIFFAFVFTLQFLTRHYKHASTYPCFVYLVLA